MLCDCWKAGAPNVCNRLLAVRAPAVRSWRAAWRHHLLRFPTRVRTAYRSVQRLAPGGRVCMGKRATGAEWYCRQLWRQLWTCSQRLAAGCCSGLAACSWGPSSVWYPSPLPASSEGVFGGESRGGDLWKGAGERLWNVRQLPRQACFEDACPRDAGKPRWSSASLPASQTYQPCLKSRSRSGSVHLGVSERAVNATVTPNGKSTGTGLCGGACGAWSAWLRAPVPGSSLFCGQTALPNPFACFSCSDSRDSAKSPAAGPQAQAPAGCNTGRSRPAPARRCASIAPR